MKGRTLTQKQIEELVEWMPGDVIVYTLIGHQMHILCYSSNVLKSFKTTGDWFLKKTEEDALDVVYPMDRPRILKEVMGREVGEDIDCVFRIIHQEKGFFWVHARAWVIGTLDGYPVILSDYINSSAEADSYSRILDDTDTSFYTVDIQTYEILYANRATRERAMVEDGEVYAGHLCYQYISGYDAPCEDCLIHQLPPDTLIRSERYHAGTERWTSVERKRVLWCGHDCMEVSVDDITSEKKERDQYRNSLHDLLTANPQALCSFRLNVTENTCIEEHGTSPFIQRLLMADTADELFSNIAGTITDESDRKAFIGKFNREALLEQYDQGRTKLSQKYRRLMEDGAVRWVSTAITLLPRQSSG